MTKSLQGILAPQDVHLDVPANCKRSVLEHLAEMGAGAFGLRERELLQGLLAREQLGSTGLGHGIAIPHTRADVDRLSGIALRLRRPVEFDAIDNKPVDIAFLLLAPRDDSSSHLKALSRVARTFKMPGVVENFRRASNAEAGYLALVTDPEEQAA
ncbi:PTS sugar transporter subunit IIA [Parvularcula maris]|uniref:PTS sugar transporter subunit IIA n=1 Tax=Parvularcula maris TaxID=2965077 RepID=A0A9X2LA75_9PROT|nr:PTS sugar transporter subunit IIA [Parvularcula maris]MCQ8185831.1 PTS sugar transporter subunit IIA [Parvularcula maris]